MNLLKLTGVPFVSQVSPVCLSSATSAQVALPLLIGAVLKTLKSSSKPLCASQLPPHYFWLCLLFLYINSVLLSNYLVNTIPVYSNASHSPEIHLRFFFRR